jgi:hypothetical protein
MYFIGATVKSKVMRYVGQLTSLQSFIWETWEEIV